MGNVIDCKKPCKYNAGYGCYWGYTAEDCKYDEQAEEKARQEIESAEQKQP